MSYSFVAIQTMAEARDRSEAEELFAADQQQDGWIGGRIIEPRGRAFWDAPDSTPSTVYRVQSFYRDELGNGRDWLPIGDGMTLLPDGMRRVLILWDRRAELGILDRCLFGGDLTYTGRSDGHGGYSWGQFLNGKSTGHFGHCDEEDRVKDLGYFSWMFATGRIGMGGQINHAV
jgi:hypothetical protein